jgi:hypothetical protein
MSEPRSKGLWGFDPGVSRGRATLLVMPWVVTFVLIGVTLLRPKLNEPFFVHSTYYGIALLLSSYVALQVSRVDGWAAVRVWLRENRLGLLTTALVSGTVLLAVEPSFRVLADEANLVGVSRSLFFHRTANFSVTGKWYFENFWDLNVVTDRRPALFPFLVSLVHMVRGYHAENAFTANALVLVAYVFSSYRLGKALGGEVLGVTGAILVAANPNAMVAARSGGFDLLATVLVLLVINGFMDYVRATSPARLAALVLHLCLLAHVRYEGWAIAFAVGAVLIFFKLVQRAELRGFGWIYALFPFFLLPRYWQSIAKAKDAEQPLSTAMFSLQNLKNNLIEYFGQLAEPVATGTPHAPILIVLGCLGLGLAVFALGRGLRRKDLPPRTLEIAAVIAVLFGVHATICFTYTWGKATHAAAARLFVWLDTAVAIASAWPLTLLGRRLAFYVPSLGRRSGAPATLLVAALLLFMHLPAAVEARFANSLIVTRDAAMCWRFFEKLEDKRILILTDRPGLYTIFEYGATDISTANSGLLNELSRKLYEDIYLIQEVDLTSRRPRPGFDVWPNVELETVYEFQNTDSTYVRIGRVNKRTLKI